MDTFFLILPIWVCCGIMTYGMAFAHLQRNWPSIDKRERGIDQACSFIFSLFGPIGAVVLLILTGFAKHGLKFR